MRTRPKKRKNNRLKYERLFNRGLSVAEIAAQCKVSKQCVSSLLKKAGVAPEAVYQRGVDKLIEKSQRLDQRNQKIAEFVQNCGAETTIEALRLAGAKFLLSPKTIENILSQQGVRLSSIKGDRVQLPPPAARGWGCLGENDE